jgi:hypothetical protein
MLCPRAAATMPNTCRPNFSLVDLLLGMAARHMDRAAEAALPERLLVDALHIFAKVLVQVVNHVAFKHGSQSLKLLCLSSVPCTTGEGCRPLPPPSRRRQTFLVNRLWLLSAMK